MKIFFHRFTHPDGTVHTMNYVAGPQGFVPQSDMIPTPHPIPAFVQEQVSSKSKLFLFKSGDFLMISKLEICYNHSYNTNNNSIFSFFQILFAEEQKRLAAAKGATQA